MVDIAIRLRAAELVRQFRDQQITNDQFEDNYYPLMRSTRDRSLKAIATAVWTLYGDLKEGLLADGQDYPAAVREMLNRCIAFLESNEEYWWERDNFVGIAGIATAWRKGRLATRRLFGKSLPAHVQVGPDTDRDWEVWPFLPLDSADRHPM
jgi:hypothetical protein